MTTFTNIHVRPAPEPGTLKPETSLPRLRAVTNDPAREYAQRPGEVEKLPDSIAAMILSKKGYSKVARNGIRVEGVTAKPLIFWSEHSVTIAEKAGTKDKVLWVLNRMNPDVIHIIEPSGEYVESIPLDEKAEWFNSADMQRVLGAKRRSQNRSIERVASLHAPDSEAAVDAATANDAAMKSIVHTFAISPNGLTNHRSQKSVPHPQVQSRCEPHRLQSGTETKRSENGGAAGDLVGEKFSPGQRSNLGVVRAVRGLNKGAETVELPSRAEGRARSSARGAFAKADRIHEIQRHLDGQRQTHEDRQVVRKSAARFGTAARNDECRTPNAFASGVTNHETRRLSAATTAAPVSEDEIW